ncbi:Deacetylases, including yeast histone deacetylase and acetoin utilization protein [Olavius algarvensis associated proteobacterium Delta 3]|nr:Deacetylases, including yeast histone deacetylase and acetoin utilization protein [Olavius algarvensis associated proteobacterium Delta 3]CAB5146398.1 Deacetylases, including yeast histone deacetylase and acetoin utilization protein [Olavius algarvensis associated proteobacterium Delta 3]
MGVRLQKILYATDFSRFAPTGIAYSVAMARRFNAKLIIFHSVQTARDDLFGTDVAKAKLPSDHIRKQTVDRITELMRGHDVSWKPLIAFGDSVANIRPLVEHRNIDLVIAMSYGLSGLKRMLMGTVVERMARSLQRPLIIVRPTEDGPEHSPPPSRIVMSCDFSPASQVALRYTVELTNAMGAELHLLHAIEAPLDEDVVEPTEAPYEQVQAMLQDRLKQRLRQLLVNLEADIPKVMIDVVQGVPGEGIPTYARKHGADLMAAGVKPGEKRFQFLSGSTTEALIRKGPCPLLVVPADIPAELMKRPGMDEKAGHRSQPTGIVRDHRFLHHVTGDDHPENPRRLTAVYEMLDTPEMRPLWRKVEFREASCDELLMLHAPEYLQQIAATQGQPQSALTMDTVTSEGSYLAARLAVGGYVEAIRQVVEGRIPNAIALVRPPGHHAERSRALGYCLFNNVALGAAYARRYLGMDRVLIVDWDVHHGNGTQHLFEQDNTVLFFSIHQYPHFPKTGFFTEAGIGHGEGYTINVPLPKGYGDGDYVAILENLLRPVARDFTPDLVLVSAGFDIHPEDPLGGMGVTPRGFAGMTRSLLDLSEEVCDGRIVFVLEGGYNPPALADSVQAVLRETSGNSRTDIAEIMAQAEPKKLKYALKRSIGVHANFWPSLRKRKFA